mmetsp:Transcript_977/g.2000  ORF Transcript_977/g.2000 Transcript_977/m.2000 type:complete len:210 (+) Transcript_977:212-841(+)
MSSKLKSQRFPLRVREHAGEDHAYTFINMVHFGVQLVKTVMQVLAKIVHLLQLDSFCTAPQRDAACNELIQVDTSVVVRVEHLEDSEGIAAVYLQRSQKCLSLIVCQMLVELSEAAFAVARLVPLRKHVAQSADEASPVLELCLDDVFSVLGRRIEGTLAKDAQKHIHDAQDHQDDVNEKEGCWDCTNFKKRLNCIQPIYSARNGHKEA